MADNFKFGKSKEDLREMRDLLLDIRTDIQKNKDEVLDWTNAEKNLNLELEKIVEGMDATGLSTQRSVVAINAARAGTLSVHDAGKMLEKQAADLAQAKATFANWEYGAQYRIGNLQKDLDEEAKNGLTTKFYQIQENLAAEKESMVQQQKKVEAIEQEGDLLEGLQGHAQAVLANKEKNTNLQEMDNKLLGGALGKMKEIGKQAKTNGGIMALGAIALMGLVMALAGHTDQIGESFGAVGVTDFKADLMGATAEATKLGFGFQEVAGSVNALSNDFGVAFGEAIKISEASMDTARALGISTEQAAGLTGQLMTMSGHSADSAQNFLKQTAALAKSAGVAPGAVMADMAGSSEEIATYTKGSGENMAQAAVKARAMGMSLGDVAKIADGLLDFGSSLEAELTASVLIGRQLNLQKARELALAGDLVGLQDEILAQVGSEAEFNEMNAIQRKALADSIGVGVGEMSKMVSEAGKGTAELARMRELDLSEIASDEAISNITLFKNNIKGIGIAILGGISSLTNFFDSFGEGWSVVGTVLTALGLAIIGIGLYLGATALSAYATGFGLTKAGVGAKFAGKGLASMATAGSAAIPLLLTIAAVAAGLGLAFFGIGYIMKQIPPILGMFPPVIDSIAAGFVIIAQSITGSILKLASPEVIMGIIGLAAGFWMLAAALGAVAIAGLAAVPALAVVTGVAAIGGAIGLGAGVSSSDTQEVGDTKAAFKNTEEGKVLIKIQSALDKLVMGFGDSQTDGSYIAGIGTKVGTAVGRAAAR